MDDRASHLRRPMSVASGGRLGALRSADHAGTIVSVRRVRRNHERSYDEQSTVTAVTLFGNVAK